MSEGIATFKNVSMGSLCDPRKQEEILNDLWVEWVKLALELELENAVRRRFPGHSAGSYGRLARWIDELGFIASDVRFLVGRLWRATVSWPNSSLAAISTIFGMVFGVSIELWGGSGRESFLGAS
jgi:hypothetical protein